MHQNHLTGAIFLIAGTAIGAGMLALPIVTGIHGFYSAVILFFLVWLINSYFALLVLEANLRCPPGSNILSMAKHTLGLPGLILAWICCACLLYSLLVAYLSGLSETFMAITHNFISLEPNRIITYSLVTLVFGLPVCISTEFTDLSNRFFMTGMLVFFSLLMFAIAPEVNFAQVPHSPQQLPLTALPIAFVSFGYVIVMPSIRVYLDGNVARIKKAIWLGSAIPFVAYIIWELVTLSIIPSTGYHSLKQILASGDISVGLTDALFYFTKNNLLTSFARGFVFFCIATSFVGVSMSLFDLLSDGLNIRKNNFGRIVLGLLTFVLPLLFVLSFKNIFISALGYGGLFSVMFSGILPTLMVWRGRINSNPSSDAYRAPGGSPALVLMLLIGGLVFYQELVNALTH